MVDSKDCFDFSLTLFSIHRTFAGPDYFGSAMLQAFLYTGLNAYFVYILVKLDPLVYYPCTYFKDKNLFLLAEVAGALVTVLG